MPLVLFLGAWVVVVLAAGTLFYGYRRWRGLALASRAFWWTLGVLALLVGMVGSAVWRTWFCPPLPLPPTAHGIEIYSAGWWYGRSVERMKFRLNETEFSKWIETLMQCRWKELDQNQVKLRFLAFHGGVLPTETVEAKEDRALITKFDPTGTWNTTEVRTGYFIKPRTVKVFSGQILYDTEREVVYYLRLE